MRVDVCVTESDEGNFVCVCVRGRTNAVRKEVPARCCIASKRDACVCVCACVRGEHAKQRGWVSSVRTREQKVSPFPPSTKHDGQRERHL